MCVNQSVDFTHRETESNTKTNTIWYDSRRREGQRRMGGGGAEGHPNHGWPRLWLWLTSSYSSSTSGDYKCPEQRRRANGTEKGPTGDMTQPSVLEEGQDDRHEQWVVCTWAPRCCRHHSPLTGSSRAQLSSSGTAGHLGSLWPRACGLAPECTQQRRDELGLQRWWKPAVKWKASLQEIAKLKM